MNVGDITITVPISGMDDLEQAILMKVLKAAGFEYRFSNPESNRYEFSYANSLEGIGAISRGAEWLTQLGALVSKAESVCWTAEEAITTPNAKG